MIPYMDELKEEERREVTQIIRTLYDQTYVLERRYDRKTERFPMNRDYRLCERHLEFLQEYFRIGGVELKENRQLGIFYLEGMETIGEKLGRITTLYVLVLKLLYDEKVNQASTAMQVFTTIAEIHDKITLFRLWDRSNSRYLTQMREAVRLLKRYQIIDTFENGQDLEGESRVVIYPTIHLLLRGEDIRAILEKYSGQREEENAASAAEWTEDETAEGKMTGEEMTEEEIAEEGMTEERMEEKQDDDR